MDEEILVRRGSFLYDNIVRLSVRILRVHLRPGSTDFLDEPDIRDDQEGEWYIIRFTDDGLIGYYNTLADAIHYLQKVAPDLRWESLDDRS